MAQGDVIKVLEEEKSAMTSREIHKKVVEKGRDISFHTLSANISNAMKWNKPKIIKFYPSSRKIPKYILKKYATKEQMEKQDF